MLCLRLVVKPFDALVELKNALEDVPSCSNTLRARPRSDNRDGGCHDGQTGGLRRSICRRCSRGSTLAQSFSLGTVARPRLNANRRSARYTIIRSESDSEEESVQNDLLKEHVKVVDAFDEILNELENVRISLPKSQYILRPSTIKQRPQSAYIPTNPRVSPPSVSVGSRVSSISELPQSFLRPVVDPACDRDSGYLSTHNSQSSEIEDELEEQSQDQFDTFENQITLEADRVEKRVFEIIDFWSLKFTGDLHYPETLHVIMAILEKLRNKQQVRPIR